MENRHTQSTLFYLEMPIEAYYAEVSAYMENYIWQIEDFFPASDAELWKMMRCRTAEYSQSVKSRGDAASTGKEPRRNFLMENAKEQTIPP